MALNLFYTCCLISSFILWGGVVCLGQTFNQQKFDGSKGLANTIYNIKQDSKGFIWIGTDKGLFRHDGIEFVEYNTSNGLKANEVLNVYIDSNDVVYVLNFPNALNCIMNGEVLKEEIDSIAAELDLKNVPIHAFIKSENSLLISSLKAENEQRNIFFKVKYEKGKIKHKEFHLPQGEVIISFGVSNDQLYIFSGLTDKTQVSLYKYYVYKEDRIVYQGELRNHYPSQILIVDNVLYIANERGTLVQQYDIQSDHALQKKSEFNLKSGLKEIVQYGSNIYFILFGGGCQVYNERGFVDYLLKDVEVNYIFLDKDLNAWTGSMHNGLYLQNYSEIEILPLQLNEKNLKAYSTFKYGNKLFIGYNDLFISIYENGENVFYSLGDKDANPNGKVREFASYGNDLIYINTDEGLYEFNLKTKSSKLLNISTGKCISLGPDSTFLIGSSMRYYSFDGKDTTRLLQQRTISSYFDPLGNIWYGTVYGLYKNTKDQTDPFVQTEAIISDRIVNDITGSDSHVFVATSSGLCQINGEFVQCIDKADGLAGNNCLKIRWYNQKLFVATSNGLSVLEYDNAYNLKEIKNYTEYDGLSSNDLNDIEVVDNILYIASNSGVCKLDLNRSIDFVPPTTNIISAKADGLELSLNAQNELKPNTQTLEIDFSGMSFGYGGKDMNYRYKLEPIMQEWLYTTDNSINFSSLDPIEYDFSVQAINNKKIASDNIATVHFRIKPTLFQSIYFKILLGILGLILLRFFLNYKTKLDKKKQENERKISELELDAIKAQINPHFIYNCLNSIKNTVAKGESTSAEKQISIFAKLIRQTLHNSHQNFIKIEDEIDYLENYLQMEKLRFKDKLDYTIESNVSSLIRDYKIPAMLIQPYVENAVKYGMQNENSPVTKVSVIFSKQDGKLICAIEDNGPGINATADSLNGNGKSFGMLISSNRAKTYNDIFKANIEINATDKKDQDPGNEGTLITIKMDINEAKTHSNN